LCRAAAHRARFCRIRQHVRGGSGGALPTSEQAFALVRGASRVATQAAALHGRLFAGRRVRCSPYDAARFAAGDWEAQ
jgi:hypothetical protein